MELRSPFNTRIIIGIAIGILLVLLIIIILFTQKPKEPVVTATIPTVPPAELSISPGVTSIVEEKETASDTLMGTEMITVRKPDTWTASKDTTVNGERVVLVPEDSGTTSQKSVSISTEIGVNQNDYNKHLALYDELGYDKTARKIKDLEAVEYKGILPLAESANKKEPDILQNTVIFVQSPGKIYTISYHYIGSKRNLETESILEDIVSTIEFK